MSNKSKSNIKQIEMSSTLNHMHYVVSTGKCNEPIATPTIGTDIVNKTYCDANVGGGYSSAVVAGALDLTNGEGSLNAGTAPLITYTLIGNVVTVDVHSVVDLDTTSTATGISVCTLPVEARPTVAASKGNAPSNNRVVPIIAGTASYAVDCVAYVLATGVLIIDIESGTGWETNANGGFQRFQINYII